jgi:UDPglucose 6-dehydrogenase
MARSIYKAGEMPIYEPAWRLVERSVRWPPSVHVQLRRGADAEFAFICAERRRARRKPIWLTCARPPSRSVAAAQRPLIVVNKSTVLVGTGDFVADIIRSHCFRPVPFSVVSSPSSWWKGRPFRLPASP